MKTYEQIYNAAIQLASERPVDQISYADVAERAGVHWTTVRRHLGKKDEMKELLAKKQAEQGLTSADTRTRLMDAAIQVFAAHGYSGATLDQVAAEAGQTKGAVYWHFSNKADLYMAICERNLLQQAQFIPQQAEAILRAGDPVSTLAGWLRSQLEGCMGAPGRPMLFFEFFTTSRDPAIREQMQDIFEVFYGTIESMFQAFQVQGLLRSDINSQSLAVFIQTVLNGLLLTWMLAPKGLDMNDFAYDAATLLWSGCSPCN
ncbi:TetR family transcriptional regulator [Paenibacillus sp. J2TS4]|uniref:TetR family transcriptional regulator n=1 Tax=Paenibacillus sp. J2TS4 TaxID=2807194 RepID=UPI001B07D534|nr:TetR family transcriptional regulator [Paenibacillus sp. J2TS4]GIP36701.1 transcriptional regulator [Paenibacillus sp. J2TS4]